MFRFALFLLLLVIVYMAIAIRKVLYELPEKELRRRARHEGGSGVAILQAIRAFGRFAEHGIILITCFAAVGCFLVLLDWFGGVVAVIWGGLLASYIFYWSPQLPPTAAQRRIALLVSPALHSLISFVYRRLPMLAVFKRQIFPVTLHTGAYEKEDIIDLLDRQEKQSDSRLSKTELRIAKHSLLFSERLVQSVMTPISVVQTVEDGELVGPVLMGQLYDSGFSRFPVFDKQRSVVGILFMKDLTMTRDTKTVKQVMHDTVCYVFVGSALDEVLDAFLKTKQHLFIVVDEYEEIVGVISIEDVLEDILGAEIQDEFDKYDDLRAVAARRAITKNKQRHHPVEDSK
jgi:CBS domain containing-hemolysin-like protein